jgi:hypothetical protein
MWPRLQRHYSRLCAQPADPVGHKAPSLPAQKGEVEQHREHRRAPAVEEALYVPYPRDKIEDFRGFPN